MKTLLRWLATYVLLSAALGGIALLTSFPARPGSWLGWLLLFALIVPLTLVGEGIGELLHRNRIAAAVEQRSRGRGLSWLRIGYMLVVMLALMGAVAGVGWWLRG